MEEDTGKSLHVGGATGRIHGADHSLLDYNRAGVPLIEIVTKPIEGAGAKAPEVARAYVDHAARPAARARASPTSGWSRARCAATRTCRCGPSPDAPLGTAHRDQERQLAAQRRAGDPLRDHPAGGRAAGRRRRSSRRPGTGTRTPARPRRAGARSRPRTTATSPSPTWCRSRRAGSGSRSCGPRCPSRRPSG